MVAAGNLYNLLCPEHMNCAFLFNSDHPSLGGYYSPPVMNRILGTRVLQHQNRSMRVLIGDVATYGATLGPIRNPVEVCRRVYQPGSFDKRISARLEATYNRATVFCWVFQNIIGPVAEEMHQKLESDPAYLGAMSVDFSDPIALRFFRNSLIEAYRFRGASCSVFYSMGSNEDPDISMRERFETSGFSVQYEDIGARRTIFDNYDTPEHFARVQDFEKTFAGFEQVGVERASDLVHSLEELHPKLFDAFAAAARALERAETEEDLAQAALSGRRLLVGVSDYLFPARDEQWRGRSVGNEQYKNRLWAYIEKTIDEEGIRDATLLPRLGAEADRLVDLFNAGLHAHPSRAKVQGAFSSLTIWLSEIIALSPKAARRPYLAYEEEFAKLLAMARKNRTDKRSPDE